MTENTTGEYTVINCVYNLSKYLNVAYKTLQIVKAFKASHSL